MGKIKDSKHEERYSIYNGDCMDVLPEMPDESVDLSVYSPPFCGLFLYSNDPRDFSNCADKKTFLAQYEFLVQQIARVTKKGRISAVHCTDIANKSIGGKNDALYDFPHDIIKLHEKYGMNYMSRVSIWKEPLKVRMRTMVRSLMHKMIVEDSTNAFPSCPDYILIFRKNGECEKPVIHENGIDNYAGENLILPHMLKAFNNLNNTNFNENELLEHLKKTKEKGEISKLNHYIWQRYASSIWDDIRIDNVLPFRPAKEEDDEKHVHPLQLDVIERIVELYSNPDEIVLTPFMGVGSEVYGAVKKGRKGIGIELKDSYYKQALRNLENVKYNDDVKLQLSLSEGIGKEFIY